MNGVSSTFTRSHPHFWVSDNQEVTREKALHSLSFPQKEHPINFYKRREGPQEILKWTEPVYMKQAWGCLILWRGKRKERKKRKSWQDHQELCPTNCPEPSLQISPPLIFNKATKLSKFWKGLEGIWNPVREKIQTSLGVDDIGKNKWKSSKSQVHVTGYRI